MKSPITFLALAALPCLALEPDLMCTWKAEFDSPIGLQKYTYMLNQDGTNLTGKANSEVNDQKREAELKEGRIDGDKILFVEMLNFQGNDIRRKLFEGISKDKVHPSLKGYQVWADGLKPIFIEILGPPGKTDHAPPPTGDPSARASKTS